MSRLAPWIVLALLSPTVFACSAPTLDPSSWRIRSDFEAALNADAGWAAPANTTAMVHADEPFRLRVEVDGNTQDPTRFALQVRRNGGDWSDLLARDFPYPDEISTPRVSIVSTSAYAAGTPTTDLLTAATSDFAGGEGVVLDSITTAWGADGHSEWEWPLVIRRYADGAVTNEEGDRFDFRLVDGEGRPLDGEPASVVLAVPPGHLGGTFVETPARLGPWTAADGALYFPMEPSETYNALMIVGSRDGGASWTELDAAHRPATVDLEGFATALHAGRVHMLHQTDSVFYHAFATTDDPTHGEGWAVVDELVSVPSDPPSQTSALEVLSDGRVVAVYGDSLGLRLRIRTPSGEWLEEQRIADDDGALLTGVQTVRAGGDRVHIAYAAFDGATRSIRHRLLTPGAGLAPPTTLAAGIGAAVEEDAGALAPLVFLPAVDRVVVIYRDSAGRPWERRLPGSGGSATPAVRIADRAVVQNAVDSDQVGMDAIGVDDQVHLLFIDEESRDVVHAIGDGAGSWSAPQTVVEGIDAQWVRGAARQRDDGTVVYGFVVDAGSDGGSGMNRYVEVPIRP